MSAILVLSLLLSGITKDEVIQMTKAGVDEATILAKIDQEGAPKSLSADDVVELKAAGVSEKIIRRLLGVTTLEGNGLRLENRSHRGVKVAVDARERTIRFLEDSGTEIGRKVVTELEAPEGAYRIYIGGRKTSRTITTPTKLTIRGCDIDEFEVLTAYVGEGSAKRTFLLFHKSKEAVQVASYRP